MFMSEWESEVSNKHVCLSVYLLFASKQRQKHILDQVSEHLVESNLQSVDSHGVIRLTQYADQVFLISLANAGGEQI